MLIMMVYIHILRYKESHLSEILIFLTLSHTALSNHEKLVFVFLPFYLFHIFFSWVTSLLIPSS